MITKYDFLPLLEPNTLVKLAKASNINIENLLTEQVLNALSNDKLIHLYNMSDVISKADKAAIANKYSIPLDGHSCFLTAIVAFIQHQKEIEEMQEFYAYVYQYDFKLEITKYNGTISLSNDGSKKFQLYPAEVKILLKLLRNLHKMNRGDYLTPNNILFSKKRYPIHKMTTNFYLNKKRNPKNSGRSDTELSLLYETAPYFSIVLSLTTKDCDEVKRIAFRTTELEQVIKILDKTNTADDGVVFKTVSQKEAIENKRQYTATSCPKCGEDPNSVSFSTDRGPIAQCKCGASWTDVLVKKEASVCN